MSKSRKLSNEIRNLGKASKIETKLVRIKPRWGRRARLSRMKEKEYDFPLTEEGVLFG